jgi:hypothetical protein
MVKVTCKINNYDDPTKTDMTIDSHWNDRNMVVVIIGNERNTVKGHDLIEAIKNAMNTNRY